LVIPRASIAHRVRRTGRVHTLSNYARQSGCAPWLIDMFCGGEGAVALAAVPLRLGQDVVGVLYGGIRQPIEIGDRVLDALEKVAALAAASARTVPLPGSASAMRDGEEILPLDLTMREREMLVLLSRGVATRGIACATGLTVNSVRTYIQAALTKLSCGSRLEAVARARVLGLL
jgi:DNA-binding CsgD family transcriptional regulator